MSFSGKTIDLILDIKEYSNGKIKNDFELSVLLESLFLTDKKPVFDELIFKAKFLYGMLNIFSENPTHDQMEKLMPEFTKNLEEFRILLKKILVSLDEEAYNIFHNKYFNVNPEIINELVILITDLSVCKDYFNDRKYA